MRKYLVKNTTLNRSQARHSLCASISRSYKLQLLSTTLSVMLLVILLNCTSSKSYAVFLRKKRNMLHLWILQDPTFRSNSSPSLLPLQ